MMNEQRRTDVQKKLDDEERIRRMKEGGEDMRAQIEMEQAERSRRGEVERGSDLGPEGERARQAERGSPHRGMGETQQAQMASWGKEGEQPTGRMTKDTDYPAGTGSRYRDPNAEPRGPASTGESFTGGPSVERPEQRYMSKEDMRRTGSDAVGYRAGTGSYYPESPEAPTERASTGESFTSGPDVAGRAGARTGKPSATDYPAGTGSVYRDPHYQDTERASTGEPFTGGPSIERPSEQRYMSREEMRRTGSDAVGYRAGTGSYYPESPEAPTERASTGEYFTSGPEATGAPRAPPPGYYAREQPSMTSAAVSKAQGVTQKVTEKARTMDTGAMASSVVSKGKDVSHKVTSKAKEFNESNKAEDMASRAGETIGKALRKTIAVAKGMSSGLKKGMSGERGETGPAQEMAPGGERETVERESTIRESPQMEERRYQEVRRREQQ
jgi:hypothetical protein